MAFGGTQSEPPAPTYLLRPGERLLWSGAPPKNLIVLRAVDVILVPFSLLWGGMVFRMVGSVLQPGPLQFQLFFLPFIAVAIYVLFGRFVYNWYRRRSMFYYLTDERAMIVGGSGGLDIKERTLVDIRGIESKLRPDGSGTIQFDRSIEGLDRPTMSMKYQATWHDAGLSGFQFFRIPDARHVRQLIDQAIDAKRRGAGRQADEDTPGWTANPDGRPRPSPW